MTQGFRLSEKKIRKLEEEIAKVNRKKQLSLDEIIKSLIIYEQSGNSYEVFKRTMHRPATVLKYVRLCGFKIKRGRHPNEELYKKYRALIKKGLNFTKMARELGVTRQAVNCYLGNHPELKYLYDFLHHKKNDKSQNEFLILNTNI